MKRKMNTTFLSSIFAYCLVIISSFLCILVFPKFYGLIAGLILTLIAIPIHIYARENRVFYCVSFIINFIGSGFSIGTYYVYKTIPLDLFKMLWITLTCVILLFVASLLVSYLLNRKIAFKILCGLLFLLLILTLVLWIAKGFFVYSFAFFMLIIALLFVFLFDITARWDRNVFRDISFTSFGAWIILTIIILVILSEGDFLDGFDFSWGKRKR